MIRDRSQLSSDPGTVDAENPWPGLAAFREADQFFFQGRETVVDELTRMVLRARLTVLHGVSGLGKTSVLRAGLFPRLRRDHVLPVYVRLSHAEESGEPVDQVREAVAHAAQAAGIEAPAARTGETLWEYFHRKDARFWDARNRIITPLLVFDQFEELFTLGRGTGERRARSEAFVTELSDLIEGRPAPRVRERLENDPEDALSFSMTDQPCKVLLSLREDFLPDLAELRGRMPTITDTMYRLQPMTPADALRVVEVDGGRLVEHDVAEQIVRFVASAKAEPGGEARAMVIEPALLSVFCRELNNKRRAHGGDKITADLLEGSRTAIISDFYERTISQGGLSAAVRIFVEERLLTESGFRDSVAEEQALRTAGIDPADIEALIQRRLLRREDAGTKGRSRLELTHDVLAEAVRAGRDRRRLREQEQRAIAERRAAEERTRREAEESAAREQQRREFEAAQSLAAKEREAAELAQALAREEQRGREAAERLARLERRARRRQIAWLSALLVATVTLASLAWSEARRASAAEAEANRALSAADVDRVGRGEPWALAYLARAIRNDPDSTMARALLLGYLSQQVMQLAEMRHAAPVAAASLDASGSRILTLSGGGTARLWDARTGGAIGGPLGGEDRLTTATFSGEGARVLTAATDGTAQVWDATTGAPIGEPLRHDGAVNAASFDATGRRVVTGSDDEHVRLWNVDTGEHIRSPAGGAVIHASFDPTGTYALSISINGDATIWDALAADGLVAPAARRLDADGVTHAAFSPDGRRIVALLMDGTARLIETRTGRPSGAALREVVPIVSAAFDPSGERVMTLTTAFVENGDGEGSVALARLWNARTGARLVEMHHEAWISTATFSPDGTRIVTASHDGTAQVWDAVTGTAVGVRLQHGRAVVWAGFSPDGHRVLTASEDGTGQLWNADSGVPRGAALRHEGPVVTAGFSPDGTAALTASADGTARLWDLRTGVPVETLLRPAAGLHIGAAAFSADGHLVATAATLDPAMPDAERERRQEEEWVARLWDVATGEPVGGPLRHDGPVNSLEFSPSGAPRVVTASVDSTARLWNSRTGEPVAVVYHAAPVLAAAFSPDGTRVVTASADSTARVWDADTGHPATPPLRHAGPVLSAAFSPDGTRVVTAGASAPDQDQAEEEHAALVWDAGTGDEIRKLVGHDEPVASVAFSPDGTRILTSTDAYSHLWDAGTGRLLGRRLRHEAAINPPVFSADGAELVATSAVAVASVWDVRDEPVLRGELPRPGVLSASFSGDGRLATGSRDGRVRIWNMRTREEAGVPLQHAAPVRWTMFSSDDSRLLTLAGDGTARIWDVPSAGPEDAELLAEVAEAVGGHLVDAAGGVNHVPDQAERLARMRQHAAAGERDLMWAESFIGWLFADPATRTISPLSRITVPAYVARLLAEGEAGRREAVRLFPGHPELSARAAGAAPHGHQTPPR